MAIACLRPNHQPEQYSLPHGQTVARRNSWYTAAGKVLFTLQEQWKTNDDHGMDLFGRLLLVPHAYVADSPYLNAKA